MVIYHFSERVENRQFHRKTIPCLIPENFSLLKINSERLLMPRTNSPEHKTIINALKLMGLKKQRKVKHGELWFHELKQCKMQLPGTPSDSRWINNAKSELGRLGKEHFTIEELQECLSPLIKKRKMRFMEDGRPKLLRISEKDIREMQFEDELLATLLPEFQTSDKEKEELIKRMSELLGKGGK